MNKKEKEKDPFDTVAKTIADGIFKESRILKLLERLRLKRKLKKPKN